MTAFGRLNYKGPEDRTKINLRKLNRALRNLSTICRRLERDNKLAVYADLDAQNWWTDYKKLEEERMTKEIAKQQQRNAKRTALSKLTPSERKLLGIKHSLLDEDKGVIEEDIPF